MLQEQILKGEIEYLRNLTSRADVGSDEVAAAREKLNNKVKGMKLDKAIEEHVHSVHVY
ncbi:hypothetical protein [Enterococcus innesii]|uniref:hypothetical protein n=1 Tax=Enterococcus innesii TaxID=2839759 RepID=UPI002DBCCB7A|nr:hypothetical protein [Enterococcus innesii]MEB5950629.1 hypothetical protein [Enterococcus innesii]